MSELDAQLDDWDGDDFLDAGLGDLVLSKPDQALVELERHMVAVGGLRAFIPLAWHVIEGHESSYVPNWHIDATAEHLEAVSRGEIRRLAIMMPPRHMKSLSVAVMWPVWDWITRPWRRFLFASYAQNLSTRDSVKCRRIVQSPWFRQRWGQAFKLVGDQNTKTRFENDKNGYRLATSVDGQLTGEGGDFIVVDDANNVRQAESEATRLATNSWWDEALSTRLNSPRDGAYVLMQQRVHENDLMGHVLTKESAVPWRILCLPAEYEPDHPQRWFRDPRKEVGELLWPARLGREEVNALKADLGPYGASAQLQQRPAPREGGIFKRSWFPTIRVAPADTVWVRGWDFAATEAKLIKADPDWTAWAKVGWSRSLQKWIIGHVGRCREEPHIVERKLVEVAEADGPGIQIQLPQDPGQAGKAQAKNLLTRLAKYTAYADPVTGDKMSRALAWAGKAGAGMVALVEGDWNKPFLDELTGFPTASHDDQVDAVSSAFDRLVNSTFGIVDWYAQQLARHGVDPGALKTPAQQQAEDQAKAAAKEAPPPAPSPDEQLKALALALGVAIPTT